MLITKEQIKAEIDCIPDEYVPIVFHVIKAFEYPPRQSNHNEARLEEWHRFIDETYGCLADDPIIRGRRGISKNPR